MRFQGGAQGNSLLHLPYYPPNKWNPELTYIAVTLKDPAVSFSEGTEKGTLLLSHSPNQDIALEYSVNTKIDDSEMGVAHSYMCARFFHCVGEILFAVPDAKFLAVHLSWDKFPENWVHINSCGNKNSFVCSPQNLINGLFLAGDFRIFKKKIENRDVIFAIQGLWPFSDGELYSLVYPTLKEEHKFWAKNQFEPSTQCPVLLAFRSDHCSNYQFLSGRALPNALTVFCSGTKCPVVALKKAFAHEYFHLWNAWTFKIQSAGQSVFWFTEGFTDYYADKINLLSGQYTPQEYLQEQNEAIEAYLLSPYRSLPNEVLTEKFHSDRLVQIQSYQRGRLLAQQWDGKIRKYSKGMLSLDDAMRELERHTNKQGIPEVDLNIFIDIAEKFLPEEARKNVQSYLNEGNEILVQIEDFPFPCHVRWISKKSICLGFDLATSQKHRKIIGVVPQSAAFQAGLLDGQILLDFRCPSIPDKPCMVTIQDENQNTVSIEFIPNTEEERLIPQFYLPEDYESL
jgi:predicted metalloprotease with PDZ domain